MHARRAGGWIASVATNAALAPAIRDRQLRRPDHDRHAHYGFSLDLRRAAPPRTRHWARRDLGPESRAASAARSGRAGEGFRGRRVVGTGCRALALYGPGPCVLRP